MQSFLEPITEVITAFFAGLSALDPSVQTALIVALTAVLIVALLRVRVRIEKALKIDVG